MVTPWGRCGGVERCLQQSGVAYWARAWGEDGVVLGRAEVEGGAREHAEGLREVALPAAATAGGGDAYAGGLSAGAGAAVVGLLVLQRGPRGVVGWVWGGGIAARLDGEI